MGNISISDTGDFLMKDGKPFFYLADTVWSAFTNPTYEEWLEYLYFRRIQGYNVLQISILPQWDASESKNSLSPFGTGIDGKPDYYIYNKEYFAHACKMLDLAVKYGFTPALVVLWCDRVKGTWLSNRLPKNIIPYDAALKYARYVTQVFSSYSPIYIISGDTDFETEDAVKYYFNVLKEIKENSPEAVTTMHISGGHSRIPGIIAESKYLDFYTYQSCHFYNKDYLSFKLAEEFYSKPVKKPIINAEPCYEGCPDLGDGNGIGKFQRFTEQDVRRAVWSSLLSGAKAGIAYGAHGIWDWNRKGSRNYYAESYAAGAPFDWRTAMRFQGAWDTAFSKWVFEHYGLYGVEPSDKILSSASEIRIAATSDYKKLVIYIPCSANIKIGLDISDYECELIILSHKHFCKPHIIVENGISTIKMYDFNSDALFIATLNQ